MNTERRAGFRLTLAFLAAYGLTYAGCAPRGSSETTIDPPRIEQKIEQTNYPPAGSAIVPENHLKFIFELTDEELKEFELANESKKYLPGFQPQNVYALFGEDLETLSLRKFQRKPITSSSPGRERLLELCQKTSPDELILEATGLFDWPVRGSVRNVNQWPTIRHEAIDIDGSLGQEVTVTDGGIVLGRFESDQGYGRHLVVNHGRGRLTNYAHLSSMLVQVGDKVGKGSTIGRIGTTGTSGGPHLHFEVIELDENGCSFVNPLLLLP